MGGGSTVSSNDTRQDFPFLSSPRDNQEGMQDKDYTASELDFGEVSEKSVETSSAVDFVVGERKRLGIYQDILQSYDELKIDRWNLEEAKEKILRYKPGTWTEKARGLKLCHYDVPETTSLILVGPSGSGKSSLINRISKVFDDDKYAPARAQESYNSLGGNGTHFLREYMIPRDSNSICLYDTRSLSDNSHENNKMLKNWMTKGVHHGELVVRSIDNQRLSESLKCKGDKKGGALEARYIEAIVSTFNNPFLSFKDDKPVLVLTHGDLLSLSDRARVRAYLRELLGIPPTNQIFDIPACNDLVTESAIIGMLRYTLEHADSNFPQKSKVVNKVHKILLSLFMILLILVFAIGLKQNISITNVTQQQAPQPDACSREVHDTCPNVQGPKKEPKIEHPKQKVPKEEAKIEWHKIRHIW